MSSRQFLRCKAIRVFARRYCRVKIHGDISNRCVGGLDIEPRCLAAHLWCTALNQLCRKHHPGPSQFSCERLAALDERRGVLGSPLRGVWGSSVGMFKRRRRRQTRNCWCEPEHYLSWSTRSRCGRRPERCFAALASATHSPPIDNMGPRRRHVSYRRPQAIQTASARYLPVAP